MGSSGRGAGEEGEERERGAVPGDEGEWGAAEGGQEEEEEEEDCNWLRGAGLSAEEEEEGVGAGSEV